MQKFRAKQAVVVVLFQAKGLYSSSESQQNVLNLIFTWNIQQSQTMFFNTNSSHIEIIYKKWVAWLKDKMYLSSWDFKQL